MGAASLAFIKSGMFEKATNPKMGSAPLAAFLKNSRLV